MTLLILLILGLAYLIGTLFVIRVLSITKNDKDLYDVPRKNNKPRHPRGVRTKIMIGRLRRTHSS
jgi:hypothetical protein